MGKQTTLGTTRKPIRFHEIYKEQRNDAKPGAIPRFFNLALLRGSNRTDGNDIAIDRALDRSFLSA